jgi:2-polyprenyl-6-methoxyphenol hydroxylase-like FAD-dependent oxidoreductase
LLSVLREAGVVDKMREKGREVYNMCWRQLGGKYIAGITGASDLEYLDRFLVLPVHQVSEILYEELGKYPNAKVLWKHAFVGLNQDESKVTATMEHNNETSSISGDFLIGCDGANSGVRKALFGRNFPGRTLDVQLVATNVSLTLHMKSMSTADKLADSLRRV